MRRGKEQRDPIIAVYKLRPPAYESLLKLRHLLACSLRRATPFALPFFRTILWRGALGTCSPFASACYYYWSGGRSIYHSERRGRAASSSPRSPGCLWRASSSPSAGDNPRWVPFLSFVLALSHAAQLASSGMELSRLFSCSFS